MKNFLFVIVGLLCAVAARAATPAFSDFNLNQFATNGNKVNIKSGANFTNPAVYGTMTGTTTTLAVSNVWDASNVKFWGAKGDGVTDDSAAVQKTVLYNTNHVVYFPPGYYFFTNIVATNSVTFRGPCTWLAGTNGEGMSRTFVTASNCDSVRFEDIIMNGRGSSRGDTAVLMEPLILWDYVTNASMARCSISGHAASHTNAIPMALRDRRVGCAIALNFQRAIFDTILMHDNWSEQLTTYVDYPSEGNAIFVRCFSWNGTNNPADTPITATGGRVSITDCNLQDGNGSVINVQYPMSLQVQRNRIARNSGAGPGINVTHGATIGLSFNSIISDNFIWDTYQGGISVIGDNITVADNTLVNPGWGGVECVIPEVNTNDLAHYLPGYPYDQNNRPLTNILISKNTIVLTAEPGAGTHAGIAVADNRTLQPGIRRVHIDNNLIRSDLTLTNNTGIILSGVTDWTANQNDISGYKASAIFLNGAMTNGLIFGNTLASPANYATNGDTILSSGLASVSGLWIVQNSFPANPIGRYHINFFATNTSGVAIWDNPGLSTVNGTYTSIPRINFGSEGIGGNLYVSNFLFALYFNSPTNAPNIGDVLTSTGTTGPSKWAAPTGGITPADATNAAKTVLAEQPIDPSHITSGAVTGILSLTELDVTSLYVTDFYTMKTNWPILATDANGKLTQGFDISTGTNINPSHITSGSVTGAMSFSGSNTFSSGTMTWGDSNKTNGVYIGPSGEVLSNANGSILISGGTIKSTNTSGPWLSYDGSGNITFSNALTGTSNLNFLCAATFGGPTAASSVTFTNSGGMKVGIGKTSPGYALDVNGSVVAGSAVFGAIAGTQTSVGFYQSGVSFGPSAWLSWGPTDANSTETHLSRGGIGTVLVDTNLIAKGTITATNGVYGSYGAMNMGTGIVTVATSASTNLFTAWSYSKNFGNIGFETNSSVVVTNAGDYTIEFGCSIKGGNNNVVAMQIWTNYVFCSIIQLKKTMQASAIAETGFKMTTISLPALCRVSVYIGNDSAANTDIEQACLKVSPAN